MVTRLNNFFFVNISQFYYSLINSQNKIVLIVFTSWKHAYMKDKYFLTRHSAKMYVNFKIITE